MQISIANQSTSKYYVSKAQNPNKGQPSFKALKEIAFKWSPESSIAQTQFAQDAILKSLKNSDLKNFFNNVDGKILFLHTQNSTNQNTKHSLDLVINVEDSPILKLRTINNLKKIGIKFRESAIEFPKINKWWNITEFKTSGTDFNSVLSEFLKKMKITNLTSGTFDKENLADNQTISSMYKNFELALFRQYTTRY